MKKNLALAQAAVLLAGVAAWAQEGKVRDAVGKAGDWTSYKMVLSVSVEESVVGGGSKSSTDPSELVYEKDKGTWTKSGKSEVITVGEKTVLKGKDGAWALKAAKKPKANAPAAVAPTLQPHQSLRALEMSSEIAAAQEGDADVYTIGLKPEGTTALLGAALKKAAVKDAAEPKCTAKLFVGKDGHVTKLELTCTLTVKSKSGKETNTTIKSVTTFKDVNSTKLEVPEEAKKALEQAN